MPTPQETAHPILKTQISIKTLKRVYTPSADEIAFVRKYARNLQHRACMLPLLKCTQRLGDFGPLTSIPRSISTYIAKHVGCRCCLKMMRSYDDARVRSSHIRRISAYLNIKPADKHARTIAAKAMEHAAWTKEDIVDENETDPEKKPAAIQQVFAQSPELVDFSAQHTVYGSKNYSRFLWPLFRGSRAAFFKALKQLEFVSSSSDQALVQAIAFARAHHRSRTLWISRETTEPDTGQKRRQKVPEKINRHQFEICLFSELVSELIQEGQVITKEQAACLSPYRKDNINRFGAIC